MAIAETTADFRIGRVVSQTFQVLKRNATIFLITAAVLLSPALALFVFSGSANYILIFRNHGVLLGMLSLVLPILCTSLVHVSLVQATITDLNGGTPNVGGSISTGWRVLGPLLVIIFLQYLGIAAAFVLLIIPGIMLALAWAVIIPVLVVEHTGISKTFGRSLDLTRGHRWQILGLAAMYLVFTFLLLFLVAIISRVNVFNPAAQNAPGTLYLAATWIQTVILSTITAAGIAVVYFNLRVAKEGVAPEQLLAAFD